MMGWYQVVKKIRGRQYLYLQMTYRENGKVKTKNKYIGPLTGGFGDGPANLPTAEMREQPRPRPPKKPSPPRHVAHMYNALLKESAALERRQAANHRKLAKAEPLSVEWWKLKLERRQLERAVKDNDTHFQQVARLYHSSKET